METKKSFSLYPLHLEWDAESEGRYFRVNPFSICKEYLNELIFAECGLANAVESGALSYEYAGAEGPRLEVLRTSEDVVVFRRWFEMQHAAKLNVNRPAATYSAFSAGTGDGRGATSEVRPSGTETSYVSIPTDQLEALINSIRQLEISLKNGEDIKNNDSDCADAHAATAYADPHCDALHEDVICDGCHPENINTSGLTSTRSPEMPFIKGPRYKCLYCFNYDLCAACVQNGVETETHKRYHNMMKVNTPDSDINRLWAGFNDRLHGQTYVSQQSLRSPMVVQPAHFNVSSTAKDIVIDIPERSSKVFDFFSNVQSESDLAALVGDHEKYQLLLSKLEGDEEKLTQLVETHLDTKATSKNLITSLDASVETAHDADNLIEVEMSKREHVISFKLLNKGPDSVCNGLKLVFRYFEANSAVPIKCTLHMGPHEFQRDHYKTLNFNCRGLIDYFSMANTCQIDLVDHDDQVVFTGISRGGSRLLLRPPMMIGIQESVYSEARESHDLETGSQDDRDDRDIISNTMTNEDTKDSELEDYDFLSDSDIDT
ncbi:LADA_0F05468g1_1 [Lachancea dasiensis]|uniref:LADA_0F05468g1_1 n=1 Tax=Lachancea dasiensis TaxID=1072105 RepID=A0A1G4JJF0_9SACH|nr:LADA_0F05468g1_1 [Lachancea dasiensis]